MFRSMAVRRSAQDKPLFGVSRVCLGFTVAVLVFVANLPFVADKTKDGDARVARAKAFLEAREGLSTAYRWKFRFESLKGPVPDYKVVTTLAKRVEFAAAVRKAGVAGQTVVTGVEKLSGSVLYDLRQQ